MNDAAQTPASGPVPSKRDFVVVMAARYAGIGLSFGVSVLIAHRASQNVVGLFFWVIAISSFLAIPACFGLNSNVHGLLAMAEAKDPKSGRRIALRGVVQSLTIGIAGVGVVLGVCGLLPLPIEMLRDAQHEWLVLAVIAVYSSSLAITLVQAEVYRYRNQHLLAGLSAGVLNNCFFIMGLSVLIICRQQISSNAMLITLAVSGAFAAIPAAVPLFNAGTKGNGWSSGLWVIRMSTPATATNLCAYLVTQAQGIMGGVFLLPAHNAILGSASRLSMLVAMSATVVLQTPLAASVRAMVANSHEEARKIMVRAARNAVFVVSPFVLIILLFSSDLLSVIFGSQYRDGANTLRVLAIAALINAAKGAPGQMLLNSGHAHLQMRLTIAGAFFALAMFGLAGLTREPIGLAHAVLAAVLFQAFIERRAVKSRLGMDIGFSFRRL